MTQAPQWWVYSVDDGDFHTFVRWEEFLARFLESTRAATIATGVQLLLRQRDDAMRVAASVWGQDVVDQINELFVTALPAGIEGTRWQLVLAFYDHESRTSTRRCYVSTQPLDWIE